MNHYEQKQAQRAARYEELAEKARQEAIAAQKRVYEISSQIPLGQPILVGHHSEKRHRADIARMDRGMQRSSEAFKKAEHYEQKADGVGRAGISSDDPDAAEKLRAKLEKLETMQALMREVNAAIRKKAPNTFQERGISDKAYEQLQGKDFAGRIGFADYQLSNNNAEIRRLKERIASLEKRAGMVAAPDVELPGLVVRESVDLNRLQLFFAGKPSEKMRETLKGFGFRWAPSEGAWQRQLSNGARYAGQQVAKRWAELGEGGGSDASPPPHPDGSDVHGYGAYLPAEN